MKPDVLNSRESIPTRDIWHCRCHNSIMAIHWLGTPPMPFWPLARFRRPGRRSGGGLRVGECQGIVVLIKCPGNLVEGTRGRRKVVVVKRALNALRGGKRVARCFKGVHFFILRIRFTLPSKSCWLRTVTAGKYVTGLLLGGAIVQWRVVFTWFRQAIKSMQLSPHSIHTVGKATRKVLRCGVTPHEHTTSCSLGETGTPAKTHTDIYTHEKSFFCPLSYSPLKGEYLFFFSRDVLNYKCLYSTRWHCRSSETVLKVLASFQKSYYLTAAIQVFSSGILQYNQKADSLKRFHHVDRRIPRRSHSFSALLRHPGDHTPIYPASFVELDLECQLEKLLGVDISSQWPMAQHGWPN